MGLEKVRCDVPCGTTQSYFHSKVTYFSTYLLTYCLLTYLLMKNIKSQMLLYTLTNFFIKVQKNMLNAFGIILFDNVVWWFDD